MKIGKIASDIMREETVPVVVVDHFGMIIMVNSIFTYHFGWSQDDLVGQAATTLMPHYLRDAHQVGFSRFISTEEPRVLGKTLEVKVLRKDESICDVNLKILSEKVRNEWHFAATMIPKS